MFNRTVLVTAIALVTAAAALVAVRVYARAPEPRGAAGPTGYTVVRQDFVRSLRLNGTVEAVESTAIQAPRLAGQNSNSLVVMRLVHNGETVKPGDMLVEFDRQEQLRNALDRRADLTDLEQQIKRRQADEVAARASDDSTLNQAQSALAKSRLELVKNDLLPKIEAEKNTLAQEEAQAQLTQLQDTYALKRAAAAADIKVLEIRRDRAQTNMRQAEENAARMLVASPLPGVAVIKTTWKNGNMLEFAEGDEVRSGQPVVEVVNPAVMRVRARVNQADINELKIGQTVRVGLDAYPDLSFPGTVTQISPIGQQSSLSPRVRNFVVLVLVKGASPSLMPDLTASLDVELERTPAVLVVPRDAVVSDGEQAYVMVQRGGRVVRQDVALGAISAYQVVVTGGLQEGVTIARNAAAAGDKGR
jgi:multidrug efflux pump subunit AcrA (membrane-fusion protein)